MKHQLHTEIEIDAAPDTVWKILTDLDQYADWNPFITSASGTLAVGERLNNRLQNPGGRAMTIKPTITEVETDRSFEWLGRLPIPGLFEGCHRFELTKTAQGTKLVHSEHFDGLLVRFMRKSLDTATLEGFQQMNMAVKSRAEAGGSG